MADYNAAASARRSYKCCRFMLTSGLGALLLWLTFRVAKPTCSIENFYVPSLNTTNNSTSARNNHTLSFDLRLKNELIEKGVGYDDINITFFYGQNSIIPIANYTVQRFKQGKNKKTHWKEVVETQGVPWEAAFTAVSNGSSVIFRVGLATRVRYKILFWYSKRHGLMVGANVDVNNSGQKVKKNGIKLKSGASEHFRCLGLMGLSILLYFLVNWHESLWMSNTLLV